jgi:hypothetical protein
MAKLPFVIEDFENIAGPCPGCEEQMEVKISSCCHPEEGVDMIYARGRIHLQCHVCDATVMIVEVAKERPQ